ncbi:MAG: MEDS domain-containing protein [Desulfobacteraceae bacterium]|nr:MEDS domain-containing protein [Desulfobacteraceae bacterium]
MPDGTHMVHLYADVPEALDVQALFLRQGIENQETVMVVSPQHHREQLLSSMEHDGPGNPCLFPL